MTGDGRIDVVSEAEIAGPRVNAGEWQPPPLELIVYEPLEDEARRSAARKTDAQLAELYTIAAVAHREAADAGDREGEADYWNVLRRAIVEEAARRPSYGQEGLEDDGAGTRRQRRRGRKRVESLIAARETELAEPGDER